MFVAFAFLLVFTGEHHFTGRDRLSIIRQKPERCVIGQGRAR